MVIGIGRVVIALPANDSLKGKRAVLRRMIDRVRNRFNVAIAEVDDLDSHRRAALGIAVVSNDQSHANSMIDTIVSFIASQSEGPVLDSRIEFVHAGSHMKAQNDWSQ